LVVTEELQPHENLHVYERRQQKGQDLSPHKEEEREPLKQSRRIQPNLKEGWLGVGPGWWN
jgi:hypothetical protein